MRVYVLCALLRWVKDYLSGCRWVKTSLRSYWSHSELNSRVPTVVVSVAVFCPEWSVNRSSMPLKSTQTMRSVTGRLLWFVMKYLYSLVCAEVNNLLQEFTVTNVRTSHILVKARISQSDGGILKWTDPIWNRWKFFAQHCNCKSQCQHRCCQDCWWQDFE